MNIQIDFRSGQPIYIQIVDQIRSKVATGELKPGDQLPTVRQLATDLRINFNTVARAYRILDEAGLISTQQGRGTYIWEPPSPESQRQLRREALASLAHHYVEEAARLDCSPSEVARAVVDAIRTWQHNGSPTEAEPEQPNESPEQR